MQERDDRGNEETNRRNDGLRGDEAADRGDGSSPRRSRPAEGPEPGSSGRRDGGRARRSNQDRTQATRAALLAAGRRLFVAKGFADTSTPEIVRAAAVTRGALYHHFREKRDLFRAVVEAEAQAVAATIEAAAPNRLAPREALIAGSVAYLDAMAAPGRARLLLIEGPAVLGAETMRALDDANAARTLREGLGALASGRGDGLAPDIAADLLSAAFDRAALSIEAGMEPARVKATLIALLARIFPDA